MGIKVRGDFLAGLALMVSALMLNAACSQKPGHLGNIVFTKAPIAVIDQSAIPSGEYRYADGLQICIGKQDSNPGEMVILTKEFSSARAPEISYDGNTMVFSAKKEKADAWQIWTLDLNDQTATRITASTDNCTDPTWLPDGRIAFSKQISDESNVQYHALFTIDPSGCCEQRITFQPHDDLNSTVMKDGRVLFSSRQLYPELGPLKYIAMRPDGTKAEQFYVPGITTETLGKACETESGKIMFSASEIFSTVNFNRPMHSLENYLIQNVASVQSVYSLETGNTLASIKKTGSSTYSLAIILTGDKTDITMEMEDGSSHLIEPVIVEQRKVPKKLPSLMNMNDPSGYIVCLNADASTIKVNEVLGKSAKIQVLDYSGLVGETDIESDGSFYVALPADQPLRFQTINGEGQVVRGPSSWIWVRPSERRGCVGCHEDSEISPENVVPKAVEKSPVAMAK